MVAYDPIPMEIQHRIDRTQQIVETQSTTYSIPRRWAPVQRLGILTPNGWVPLEKE